MITEFMVTFFFFLKDFLIYLFIYYLFLTVLGLCCYARAFSSCGEWRLFFIVVHGLLIEWLLLLQSTGSRCVGFSSCGMWAQ